MSQAGERIKKQGKKLLRLELWRNPSAVERYKRLNTHQRGMIIGWLGKLRVWNIWDGLDRVERRIAHDNQQK